MSHLLALHHCHELGWKAEAVPGPGEHRDYESGPPFDRDVGRRLERWQHRLSPRQNSRWRGRPVGPRGAKGSDPEGSKSLLILATRWPSAAARRRRSGRCRRCCSLPAPLRATGPLFPLGALATKSRSRPDSSCDSGGGSSCGRKGRQGFLVVAPLRAATFAGRWRRHHQHRSLLPASFRATGSLFLRGTFTSGVRTSRRSHGRAEL
jgi:hypothetical protein